MNKQQLIEKLNNLIKLRLTQQHDLRVANYQYPAKVGRIAARKALIEYISKETDSIKSIIKDVESLEEPLQLIVPNEAAKEIKELKMVKQLNLPELDKDLGIDIIYIKKHACRHIILKEDNGVCPICGLNKKTSSHHVIPKRLGCKNPYLAELRIKMCQDCHNAIHSESRYIVIFNLLFEMLYDLKSHGDIAIDKYQKIRNFIRDEINAAEDKTD